LPLKPAPPAEQRLQFGPFELLPAQKTLLEEGRPVRLGGRAVELLIALTQRAGDLITKDELTARAWPGAVVDDANLRVHVSALRKVLGDGQDSARYIVNVSGRGYRFVAPVLRRDPPAAAPDIAAAGDRAQNLPAPVVRMIGRGDIVRTLGAQLRLRRFVSVIGPGGIGKSTVALAAAAELTQADRIQARYVDLAAIADPGLVAAALATVLGLSVPSDGPVPNLVAFLARERMLILLDNCEHVIGAVAELTERIFATAPNVQLLTTSRERLRAAGEWVYRLPPLRVPPRDGADTAEAVLAFPAVQLFVERTMANQDTFALNDADAPVVAAICRQLDGVPLAIELAASRVDMFGIRGLAARLDERILVLAKGRRTALPRQQTLRAMLDWSYELLSEQEKTILHRIGVFRGEFTHESAVAVAADDVIGPADVLDGVMNLASKSLVTTDVSGKFVYHRLLHMTRVYAFEKLVRAGDRDRMMRRLAEHCCDLLARAEADWEEMTRPQWLAVYTLKIEDIRSSLDWAFSPAGDAAIGVRLTAAALPLGFQMSLIDEFRSNVERALRRVADVSPPEPFAELRLDTAFGRLTLNTKGSSAGVLTTFNRAMVIARQQGIPKYEVEPLAALAIWQLDRGDTVTGMDLTRRLTNLAATIDDPVATLVADRTSAQAHHFFGDHATARPLAERVIARATRPIPFAYSHATVDYQILMRMLLARMLWLQGFADQAVRVADESMVLAESDSAFSLCLVLCHVACPIALWRGDHAAARVLVARLLEQATRYTLGHWHTLGQCYAMALSLRAGGAEGEQARAELSRLAAVDVAHQEMLVTIDESIAAPGATARAEGGAPSWCVPEILRAKAVGLIGRGTPEDLAAAEAALLSSVEIARAQGARAWELRSVTSLARLWSGQQRGQAARERLASVYAGFTEGFDTADMLRAKSMLAELSS
jgi:predicted ATPase/DNA-binding winged helix-turn-helix (wHTH) protein